jgi:hypothetical protein
MPEEVADVGDDDGSVSTGDRPIYNDFGDPFMKRALPGSLPWELLAAGYKNRRGSTGEVLAQLVFLVYLAAIGVGIVIPVAVLLSATFDGEPHLPPWLIVLLYTVLGTIIYVECKTAMYFVAPPICAIQPGAAALSIGLSRRPIHLRFGWLFVLVFNILAVLFLAQLWLDVVEQIPLQQLWRMGVIFIWECLTVYSVNVYLIGIFGTSTGAIRATLWLWRLRLLLDLAVALGLTAAAPWLTAIRLAMVHAK